MDGRGLSGGEVHRIDGFSRKAESTNAYLIGQLGKNAAIENNPITLQHILDEVYGLIDQARRLLGGRMVVVECENQSLTDLYLKHGFTCMRIEEEDDLITLYQVVTT